MTSERKTRLTDRWGAQSSEAATLDRFAELFDDLDPADQSYCVVDINDDQEWYVEFSMTTVSFGNAAPGGTSSDLVFADRSEALAIAAEFLAGDFDALRRRPWAPDAD